MTSQQKVRAEGARKILADEVAAAFKTEIQEGLAALPNGIKPKLVGILANTDPASRKYAEMTGRTLEKDGLRFELREVKQEDVEDAIEEANKDNDVHGIMVYFPIFGALPCFHGPHHDDFLRDCISPTKDVEGMCHFYRHALYLNHRKIGRGHMGKCVLPCTPLAVVKFLEHLGTYNSNLPLGNRLCGKVVTIVNRSEVLGRPLAAMLANDGAIVNSVDIDSTYIFQKGKLSIANGCTETLVRGSDVVVLGVPSQSYKLDPSWVKEGAIVVNVAFCKNIDDEALLSTRPGVGFVGAVGKVTIAMLERNLLRCYENFNTPVGKLDFGVVLAESQQSLARLGA
jgi:methylenetetrahydrofolate dehydrogenase (NAD+)